MKPVHLIALALDPRLQRSTQPASSLRRRLGSTQTHARRHAIDTTATGFVTTPPRYPIHVHWTTCEYEPYAVSCVGGESADPTIKEEVVAGVNRWAEIIAPSPLAPGPAPGFCGGFPPCDWATPSVYAADGLHLFIDIATEKASYASVPPSDTENGLAPWGFVAVGAQADLAYTITLHEIGHVLGIGDGSPHFREHLSADGNAMSLPKAVAIFNRDGGSVWDGPKVPTSGYGGGRADHWNRCLVPQDVMSNGGWYYVPDPNGEHYRGNGEYARQELQFVTELTAASLRPGYVYDPAQLRPAQHGWPLDRADRARCQEQYGG